MAHFVNLIPPEHVLPYLADVRMCRSCDDLLATMKRHGLVQADFPGLQCLYIALTAENNPPKVREEFFTAVLPSIAARAEQLYTLFGGQIPIIEGKHTSLGVFTREQCAVILSSMFLCIIQPQDRDSLEFPPTATFINLFARWEPQVQATLQLFLTYFAAVSDPACDLRGSVYIRRNVVDPAAVLQQIQACEAPLGEIEVRTMQSISTVHGSMQIDFANEYLGGGVLMGGCVQEEILFSVAPEHLVSLVVCPRMEENEAVAITGAGHWAKSSGYGFSLGYAGPNDEPHPPSLREAGKFVSQEEADSVDGDTIAVTTVAIDAYNFSGCPDSIREQLLKAALDRECIKAYAGFSMAGAEIRHCEASVATGNWGCGAFCGHRQIKALLQWIAASVAGKKMIFCAFREADIVEALQKVQGLLAVARAVPTVADVYSELMEYGSRYNPARNDIDQMLWDVVIAATIRAIARQEGPKEAQ